MYSWIRYGLDIVGDLYWATTAHFDYDREVDGSYKTLYDYYELHGFPHTAGDGYLTYPGRPYGIYGPVSTLRLEATCDGLEEYDLLYALERLYENHTTTENFDELYDYITRKVVQRYPYPHPRQYVRAFRDGAGNAARSARSGGGSRRHRDFA